MLQRKVSLQRATSLLQQGLERCGRAEETRRSRSLLNFTMGYLYQQEASRNPKERDMLLRKSEEYYRSVLQEQPSYEAAARNLTLVYRQLGEKEKAAELLSDAVDRGADKTGSLAMQQGDLYRETGSWNAALKAYTVAVEKSDSDVPRRRVVEVYQNLPAAEAQTLLSALPDWELQFPRVVKNGYETVVKKARGDYGHVAEESLLLWADLLARKNQISLVSFDNMPAQWGPATTLRGWLEYLDNPSDPERPSPDIGFDPASRHVFARLALAAGARHLSAGRPRAAATVWESGLEVAPRLQEYDSLRREYQSFSLVRSDLITELAFLYFQHPDVGAGSERLDKLADLTNELFDIKGDAYQSGDVEAIQRLHTALGLIYVKMDEWGPDNAPGNAHFQLKYAIANADEREKITGFYQPLPELKSFLAGGQRKLGMPREAGWNYLRAAQGYLDIDQLGKAREMLELATSLDAHRIHEDEFQQTERILRARRRIARVERSALNLKQLQREFARGTDHDWIYRDSRPSWTTSFVSRQRFKTLSDLAILAKSPRGSIRLAVRYARDAFGSGLDHVVTLIGTPDLTRLEEIVKLCRGEGVVEAVAEVRRSRPPQFDGRIWQLFLEEEYRPMFVLVRSEDIPSSY